MHVLDRPVWNALTTRQAKLALGTAHALRFAPEYGVFAATADSSDAAFAALAGLIPTGGAIATVEPGDTALPPGTKILSRATCNQMVAQAIAPADAPDGLVALGDSDAPAMVELATLTKPGPFFARTHALGDFVGVKQDGRLVAMAGERMTLIDASGHAFTEVSGVCTHPDFRGRGLAGALMRIVAARILARGEKPFLHVYAHNTGAIALYEALGFGLRNALVMTMLERD